MIENQIKVADTNKDSENTETVQDQIDKQNNPTSKEDTPILDTKLLTNNEEDPDIILDDDESISNEALLTKKHYDAIQNDS